jgi:hypothetical protein
LRKICGPPPGNGNWSIKENTKIYNTFISSDIVTLIKVSRFEWLGHFAGMDGGRKVMKLLKVKPGGGEKNMEEYSKVNG